MRLSYALELSPVKAEVCVSIVLTGFQTKTSFPQPLFAC
jgi:hypothetical protein